MKSTGRLFPWFLAAALLAWAGGGAWPLAPVEGDEQGVIFGIEGMLHPEDAFRRHARYLYEVQPGSYHLLATVAKLTGATAATVFGVATVAGGLGFLLAGARLLQLLSGWPLPWLLVVMLWAQEVTAAISYTNTSALAGGIALGGVLLARRPGRRGWLGAGLALAAAGWLRADSLLIAPACLGLAYWSHRKWWPALARTAAIALVAMGAVGVLYALSGTSPFAAAGAYAGRGYLLSGWRTLLETTLLLLSPALALAAIAGAGLLVIRREFAPGLVLLTGFLPSLLAYGTSLTTPKYFYYAVPFLLIPAVLLADWLRLRLQPWPRLATVALGVILAADGLLGLRTLEPAQRYFTTAPTWATLASATAGTKHLALVAGPGELIINADGFRLRTGQLFAPLCWHREKQRMNADRALVRAWLDNGRDLTVYWANWLPYQIAARELLATGFAPPERSESAWAAPREDWRRGGQVVHLAYLGYAGSNYQPAGPAPAAPTGDDTYFIGDRASETITELADGRRWRLLSPARQGLINLHQRR